MKTRPGGPGASVVRSLSAITDFALFSLTGLALTTVLGRFMPRESYGVFAAAFASYLVLLQAHGSVLAEPMLVLSSQRFAGDEDAYLRTLLRLHGLLSVVMLAAALLLALGGVLAGAPAVSDAAIAVGIAAPALTLMQFLRRVCYGRFQIVRAALGGAVYLSGVLCALWLMHRSGTLSVRSSFLSMAFVSMLVSWAWLVGFGVARSLRGAHVPLAEVWRAHWHFAAWGTLTALLSWIPWNAWFVLLPVLAGAKGLGTAAELRAVFNLVQPMMQVNAALGTLLMPTFAARTDAQGRKAMLRWLLLLCGGSALYAPLMIAFGPTVMHALYAGRYGVDALTLWRLAPVPAGFALYIVLKSWALALGEPRRVFVATLVSGLSSATIGVILCMRGTLADAALALAIAFGLQSVALAWLVLGIAPSAAAPMEAS